MTAVAADPNTIIQNAVKKITTIATLPEVTSKIIATVEDPKSTATQLHKIVSHDPALVTRILKVVNSSFYGLPGQIGSVEQIGKHTSELQSQSNLVCRLLPEKKKR